MYRPFHPGSGLLLLTLALAGCGGGDDGGKQAQIRLVNVSPGYQSLDLYVDKESNDDNTPKSTAVGYETAADYVSVDSDTYVLKFKRAGVSSTLLTLSSEKLTDESHFTYVAYGSNGRFATQKISEDVADADTNKSKIGVINTAEAGLLDVYLTEPSVALPDATPQFSSLGSGSSAAATTLESGTYRLRVTGAGDTTDLRLDLASVTLESKKVTTLILTGTPGGVLVNAVLLPQQGSLTVNRNTKARVRGANGVANGTAVTAKVGSATVLNAAAVGVIGSKYGQIDSGSAAITLSVDGTPASVEDQTLAAGGDYTLLVWSNANGTQVTLISDDNRLPATAGKAKMRLLNGMSAFGGAITLSVDFSPIAEGVVLGEVSDYTEVDAGSDTGLDVTNSATTANLLSRGSVSLADGAVYTLFMSGGGTATVGGTLRKDR